MRNVRKYASRRRALALLGGALASPLARADEPPALVSPPAPRPPTPPLAPASTLGKVDKEKSYIVFFQQNIDLSSMKTLRGFLSSLIEGDVKAITLAVSSTGGLLLPALQMYSFIQSLPAKINTHGQVFVGSAANVLYLAGQDRSADGNAKFLFHPAQSQVFGAFNSSQFEDQLRLMNDAEEIVESIYHDRTKLPEPEIKRFRHETVVYDAAQALEYGIVHRIGEIGIPADGKAKLVFVE